jgi:hypothetical protein
MAAALVLAAVALQTVPIAQADLITLDQRTYGKVKASRFNGLLYLYSEDIVSNSSNAGFARFTIHVIAGRYRAPLLGDKGYLTLSGLNSLLGRNPDVWRDRFSVSQRAGEKKSFRPPSWLTPFSIQVERVTVVKGGTGQVTLSVR